MTNMSSLMIGQYVDCSSILHRLDPRTKIIGIFIIMLSILLLGSIWSYMMILLFVGVMIRLSKVPFFYVVRSLKPIWIVLAITFTFHVLLTPGESVLYQYGIIHISIEGLWKAVSITMKIILLVMSASLLTLTTSTSSLTDGLASLLNPLKKLGLPVQQFAFMITITLRFIPILMLEAERVIKAQKSRGVIFSQGNWFKRIYAFIPILIPLVILSFQKADSIATAIESRGYQPSMDRTPLYVLKLHARDYLSLIIVCSLCFGMIVLR